MVVKRCKLKLLDIKIYYYHIFSVVKRNGLQLLVCKKKIQKEKLNQKQNGDCYNVYIIWEFSYVCIIDIILQCQNVSFTILKRKY